MFSYIPDVEYHVFQKNFVYRAALSVKLGEDTDVLDKRDEIIQMMNLSADQVKSENQDIIISFFKDKGGITIDHHTFTVIIPGDFYKSVQDFDFCYTILTSLIRLFPGSTYQLVLTTQNRFYIKDNFNHQLKDLFLAGILSPSYLRQSVQSHQQGHYSVSQNNNLFLVAENKLDKDQDGTFLQLNITSFLNPYTSSPENIRNCILDIGKDSYNLWHWTISDEVINVMEGQGK